MKAWLLVLATSCCVFVLSSCTEVTFPEPQPKGVPALLQMPPSIRGEYLNILTDTDTLAIPAAWKQSLLVIDPWGYYELKSGEEYWKERISISDSLVVKYYKEYYFVNIKSGSHWSLALLKPTASDSVDLSFINLSGEEPETEIISRVSKVTEVKPKVHEYTVGDMRPGHYNTYEINPTPDQLMSLIRTGVFTKYPMVRVRRKQ